ncbi:putative Regulator protein [Streptomyces aurantiacus JA 4570]|uniref:Putative Regulator protein n=1 Tax=Streptomyces aurantiacus JA 4570 TaxID=1286094 RepID=S3ZRD9_9ACTN|nr:putative Regulator protein [Streptomyces aurantiacus JA 4570]
MRVNNHVGAEAIAAALWESPPRTALRQIQTKVWKLRDLLNQAFAHDSVQQRPQLINQAGGYLLFVEPPSIDLVLFHTYVKEARKASSEGEFEKAARKYRAALSLWRGPAFAGISAPSASAPGIRAEAIKLEDHRITVTEERIGTDLILGRHHEVITELQSLVETYPLRERFRLHLIRALARVGRRHEAVETYLEGHRLLTQEFGLDLSPDLTEAYRVVLAGGPLAVGVPRQLSPPSVTIPPPSDALPLVTEGARYRNDSAHAIASIPAQGGERRLPGPTATGGAHFPSTHHPYRGHRRPPAHLEPILEQLLNGATDLTASRRLGLSPRTFSRRVSELLEYLGVVTRFQAGAEAYSRGWITIRPDGAINCRQFATRLPESVNSNETV